MKGSRKSFDELVTSPGALWVIAISLSIFLWTYVTGLEEGNYITRKFSCPLEYRALDSQVMLRNRVSEVDIEIRGREESIARLNYDEILCWIDARNLAPGKRYTQNVNITLPQDIELISCVPSQIVLDLARQIVRLMPVEIVLPQDMPEGQYLEGVEIIPKEVGIRGTVEDVAKVGALRAAPTVAELEIGKELLLPVRFVQSEPFDDNVTLEPNQIRFKGSLVRGLPKKRVPVNVRLNGQPDRDHEVKSVITDPAEVQIEGERSKLALVEALETETVDISLFGQDNNLVVPLKLPEAEGVSIVGAQSVKVTVQLGDAAARKTLANIPVEIINAENLSQVNNLINKNPEFVSVNVEGLPSVIENLTRENSGIRAYADLANIFITPVTLPVVTEINNASADLKIIRVDPPAVTISISDNNNKNSEPEELSMNNINNNNEPEDLGAKSVISVMQD